MLNSSSKRRFGKNLAILAIGELLTRALTFVAFVHLARVLTPDTFGLVELALAVLMIVTLLVDQGFPTFGAREIARSPQGSGVLVEQIVSAQVLLSVAGYLILAALALSLPISRPLMLLLLGLGLSTLGLPFLLTWVFQGQKRMTWVAVPSVLRQLVFAGIVLVAVRTPGDVQRLAWAEIAAVTAAASCVVLAYRRSGAKLTLSLKAACRRDLFAKTLPIGGSQLIWVLRMYLPTIALGIMLGQTVVGHFGAAHRLMMVVQTLMGVYFINLFPTMSQAAHDSPARLTGLLHRSLALVTWPAVGLALATTLCAPTLIRLVFGQPYMRPESVGVLAVMIWIIPILVWRRHLRSALVTLDLQGRDLICSIYGMLLLLALLPILTMGYGPVGTAWAMVASEAAAAVLTYRSLRRHVPALRLVKCLIPRRWSDDETGDSLRDSRVGR